MSVAKACCKLPPVSSDYEAQGSEFTLGDGLKIYETKNKSSQVVLICAYDIFGYHPNTKQFADQLSSCGMFRVAMPDFFRGKPFSLENFPPKDPSEIMNFVSTTGSWDNVVKKDLLNIIEHYKKEGATSFGIYGFCWGGKMSIKGVSEVDDIKAAALLHPAFIESTDAEAAKGPVLFLPSKDEADMIPLYEIVKQRLGEENTEHHRFDDMHHGFAAARGDWKDELQRKRAEEAISLVHVFFKKHLVK